MNIIEISAVLLTFIFVVVMLFSNSIPAGYHKQNGDGTYEPVKTSLFKDFIRTLK